MFSVTILQMIYFCQSYEASHFCIDLQNPGVSFPTDSKFWRFSSPSLPLCGLSALWTTAKHYTPQHSLSSRISLWLTGLGSRLEHGHACWELTEWSQRICLLFPLRQINNYAWYHEQRLSLKFIYIIFWEVGYCFCEGGYSGMSNCSCLELYWRG